MSSLLKSTRNTRALPTGTMRYIRSDVPLNLTDEEIQWLLDNNIKTLVDLRSDEEVCKQPCGLAVKEGFQYFIYRLQVAEVLQNHLNIYILYIHK